MSERKKQRAAWPIWVAVALPVLYVLSFGPVAAIARRTPHSDATHEMLLLGYAPILLVRKQCPPFHELTDWYISLWCRRAIHTPPIPPSSFP